MIDPVEAARVWGELVRLPADTIRDLDLAGGAAEVLVVVGLPVDAEPFFAADPAPARVRTAAGSGPFVRLCTDFGLSICVVPPDGEIWSAPDGDQGRSRRVNADLAAFAACLLLTCETYRRFPNPSDPDIDVAVEDLHRRLSAIDGSAFADPDDWWSVVVEQLRDGLL